MKSQKSNSPTCPGLIAATAVLLCLVVGCSRQINPGRLIGSWKWERPRTDLFYTFNTNNTFSITYPKKLGGINTGTWSLNGSVLTMSVTGATYVHFDGIPSSSILGTTNETVSPAITTEARISGLTDSQMTWGNGLLHFSTILKRVPTTNQPTD